MATSSNEQISRRSAAALAAALAATVVTAVAAYGGIQHWGTATPAPTVQVAHQAPAAAAPQYVEASD
jgi:hypothetical protein